jgi:tetratricopeptide (TPR) repeat protein
VLRSGELISSSVRGIGGLGRLLVFFLAFLGRSSSLPGASESAVFSAIDRTAVTRLCFARNRPWGRTDRVLMRSSLIWLVLASLSLPACASSPPLPARAQELNRAGVEALARGDLETADARLNLALEYSPRFVDALTNLGLVELQRGNFARAEQLLTRARRLNPDVAQPHHALGVLRERERRPDLASEHYHEALRVDPGFAPARENLGRLLFAAGLFEDALVQFKRLVEVAPDQPGGHAGLAETLIRLGRLTEADAVVKSALERLPDAAALRLLEARARLRRGEYAQAIALLAPLARGRDDTAVAALGWLATVELARGRPRHAVGAAERALALDAQDPVATYAMARALSELGDPAAEGWLLRASALAPAK